ncbi:hypothetical protein [Nocardiopsis sp. FR26]|uniref:hypothetical protein n=1 Tax=Nocardiopsis sp. FR26 TaxID=2605987 RepID=UPI0013597579|nr:hypothetical protein [Nocardiopsis sp. FR26]
MSTAALALAAYLEGHGWPDATAAMTGITGTGRVLWYAPGARTAEDAGDSLVGDWLDETQALAEDARAALGVLVTARRDFGPARIASWWAWLDVEALARLMRADLPVPDVVAQAPMPMHLSTATVLLRAAGLGTPLAVGQ